MLLSSSLCLLVSMLHPKLLFHTHPTVLCGFKEMAVKHIEMVGMNKKNADSFGVSGMLKAYLFQQLETGFLELWAPVDKAELDSSWWEGWGNTSVLAAAILHDTALVWRIYTLLLTGLSWEAGKNRDREEADIHRERSGGWLFWVQKNVMPVCAFFLWAFDLSNLNGRRESQGESLANRTT